MYEGAINIAQLVSVYQQIFGIEQVITIMLDNSYVAAAVLISHILRVQRVRSAFCRPFLKVPKDRSE